MDSYLKASDFQNLVIDFHPRTEPFSINFIYQGEINHFILKTFTSLAENNLKKEVYTVKKKAFAVMVECLQNISMHAYSDDKENNNSNSGHGIFLFSNNNKKLNIVTGNIIQKENEKELEKRIQFANLISKKEQKNYHKKLLKESFISDKGSTGLGFIDIVKRTQNTLAYKFHQINDKTSLFIMSAQINKDN